MVYSYNVLYLAIKRKEMVIHTIQMNIPYEYNSLFSHSSVDEYLSYFKFQFSSVTQSCQTLCNPMDCSTPGFSVHHQLPELTQTHIHLILCRPLLRLPSIFPSIRVFSNESVLHIRWPKYWSFSFSISPSNEYSGPISFRID